MRPKYRGFATSDPREGVHLTEKGEKQAIVVLSAIGPPTFEGKIVAANTLEIDPRRPNKNLDRNRNPAQVIQEIRSKILFRRFQEGKIAEAEVVHLLGLVGLYDHTIPSELRKAFEQLRRDAKDVNDTEVIRFLESVSERFGSYLGRAEPPARHQYRKRGDQE